MQEGSWSELKEYFKKVADDESKKKLKSHAQQKGYLQKLGLLIQPESWHYSQLLVRGQGGSKVVTVVVWLFEGCGMRDDGLTDWMDHLKN